MLTIHSGFSRSNRYKKVARARPSCILESTRAHKSDEPIEFVEENSAFKRQNALTSTLTLRLRDHAEFRTITFAMELFAITMSKQSSLNPSGGSSIPTFTALNFGKFETIVPIDANPTLSWKHRMNVKDSQDCNCGSTIRNGSRESKRSVKLLREPRACHFSARVSS